MSLETISKKFTEETLDTIIRNIGGTKHKSWRFGDAFGKDASFISEVCRLIITGIRDDETEFEVPMIIKSMPKSLPRRMSVRSVDFFRNEINFYEIVLKKFDIFLKTRNVTNGLVAFPRCYASLLDGDNDFIALEDLTFDGYKVTDKTSVLNFENCKQILITLAKFHAISLAIRDQEPCTFKKIENSIEETYYNDNIRTWYEPYQRDFIFATRDAITREYGGTVYETKMKEFTGSTFYDTMCRLTRERSQFSVICHGDLWTPNFLFKNNVDNNIVTKVKIIDFQMSRFASPVTDISFFIYACTGQDIREPYFDELIQIYHRSAIDFLTLLGSDASIFSLSALQQELKHYARFGVGMAMGGLSLCLCRINDNEKPKLGDVDEDAVVPLDKILVIKPCQTKEGRLRMASTYKHAIDCGFFE